MNKVVWEQKHMSIEEIIFRANQLCNEWQATQAAKIVSHVTNSPHPIAWRLPKQNALKCNADAAFIPNHAMQDSLDCKGPVWEK
ncbi:hypothetical protein GH714_032201 [Hevea brasiliensis]|uniref:RNase H type-1 domain-containing protein n=1 Tax=Hevea brasiliensis TaxID=3981 RepID=A0A6A6L1G4_HEVBR|nr:hypothetical protein GH714_032201 [Hevea brasiliensis]